MKIPEPIIDPTTIIAASIVPSSRTSDPASGFVSVVEMSRSGTSVLVLSVGQFKLRTRKPGIRVLWITRLRPASFVFHERSHIGDRLVDRLAPPVGQRGIERAGQLVDQMSRRPLSANRLPRGSRGNLGDERMSAVELPLTVTITRLKSVSIRGASTTEGCLGSAARRGSRPVHRPSRRARSAPATIGAGHRLRRFRPAKYSRMRTPCRHVQHSEEDEVDDPR